MVASQLGDGGVRQLLHPVPWDVRLLPLAQPEKPLNEWSQAVLQDPFVVDAAMREIGRKVGENGVLRVADSLAQAAERRYRQYLEYDRLRVGLVPDVGTADASVAVVAGNVALLRRWRDSSVVAFHAAAPAVLDFETRGFVGADLTALEFD